MAEKLTWWTECHYRGLSRRPARIKVNSFGSYFLMGEESEDKYYGDVNSSKFTSFVNKNKGVGVAEIGDYLFLGVRLFGCHTLMMWNKYWGGAKACMDFAHYEPSHEEKINPYELIVGDLLEMTPFNEGHVKLLTDDSRERLLIQFNKIISEADQAFTRYHNRDEADKDLPIIEAFRKLLA